MTRYAAACRLALLLCCTLVTFAPAIPSPALPYIARQQKAQPEAVPLAPPELNVNFGVEQKLGRFMPDQYQWLVGGVAATDQFVKANAVIGGADPVNLVMYKSHRYGKLTFGNKPWGYDIPFSKPGVYNCTVHFAETSDGGSKAGARVFDLSITPDGSKAYTVSNLDVFATTKAKFTVHTETAARITVKRTLKIRVTKKPASALGAFMSGLTCALDGELPKGVTAPPPPKNTFVPSNVKYAAIGETFPEGPLVAGTEFNLNCGGKKIGRFLADNPKYLHYGPSTIFSKPNHPIGGAEEINLPAMTDSRYGVQNRESWGYQVPMGSPGMWNCTLHFAELIEVTKVGDRVFHAQVQDQQMNNIDVTRGSEGAVFTNYVRTFENVIVANVLVVRLYRVKGDPSINAITCARSKPMTLNEAHALLTSRALQNGVKPPPKAPAPKPASEPATKPSPASSNNTQSVSPGNAASVSGSPAPVDVPPNRTISVPVTNTSLPVSPAPSSAPSLLPSTSPVLNDNTSTQTSNETIAESPAPLGIDVLSDFTVDTPPTPASGQTNVEFRLELTVTNGTVVDNAFKNQLKEVLAHGASANASDFSIKAFSQAAAPKAAVQQDTKFESTAVATLNSGTQKVTTELLQQYLADGKGTTKLQELGCEGCQLTLASAPTVTAGGNAAASASSTGPGASTIVAAVVGSVLGALLIVALIAFFVIQRHRQNEVNPAAFDAPPPPEMEDSDGEAPPSSSAHSESERSVDYLDDDSTFTAATSRQGDPEAGVTLDKDVWGRSST